MAWSVHDGAVTSSQAVHGMLSQGGRASYEGTPGLGGALEGLMFPMILSGQVCKLQPTQSIKRCETYSENVSCNQ